MKLTRITAGRLVDPDPGGTPDLPRRARWCAAVIAYVVFAALTLRPVWSGRVEPKWDGRDFNYPAFAYAGNTIKHGRLPLWNPYSNCGEPFISDPAYLWYQPGAVAAALARESPFDGYMLFWTGIWAWSGIGALLLAAVLGAGPVGSFVAAVSFSFSGFFVGHGQHLPYLVTAAWLPWVLAFAHAAVARKSRPLALLAGVSLGMSALGGYAGLVVFECLALILWLGLAFLVPRWGTGTDDPVAWKSRAAWVGGVLAVAGTLLILIWSPGLYAFLVEARDFTDRTRPVADTLALYGNPFPLTASISFLFPQITVDRREIFPSDVSMINAYLGVLAPLFALNALVSNRRRRVWILLFVGVWFWVSLGGTAGLRTILHYAVPATRFMRHNGMLRVLFLAPLAALAGVGISDAFSGRRSRHSTIAWGWLVFICVMAVATAARLGLQERVLWAVLPGVLAALAAAAAGKLAGVGRASPAAALIMAALFAVDLAWHTRTNSFTEWQDPPLDSSIRRIEQLGSGFDPMMPRETDPFFRLSKLNLVNRIPVVEGYVALKSSAFEPLVRGRFAGVLALHRYWLSPSAWIAPGRATGVAALARLGPSDPVPVLVDNLRDTLHEPAVVPGSYGMVRVSSYEPERVELEIDVPGTSDAVLVSTERTSPSWQVYVDDTRRDLKVVNYFFKGVRVPPGHHDIVFEYSPHAFVALLVFSYGTLLVTLAVALWMWRRERTPTQCRVDEGLHVTCDSPSPDGTDGTTQ